MQLFSRTLAYLSIFIIYIVFMKFYAPLGISWLDWHAQRIFNATEFLKINGYFTSYGFTIWDACSNCSLEYINWKNNIYLSLYGISLLPYILLNHFGGIEMLYFAGPIIDKIAIFSCGILISELFIRSIKIHTHLPLIIIGSVCFTFFIISPWTYKMLIAPWFEVYFLMFFLLGMLFFQYAKNALGLASFFVASIFHAQWAIAITVFYILVAISAKILGKKNNSIKYFPFLTNESKQIFKTLLVLLIPVLAFISIRIFADRFLEGGLGSSILFRIGISGDDIHNGGLLGAIQFLGGNRITQCIQSPLTNIISNDLTIKIALFNCTLSILGMIIISLISIVGAYFFIKSSTNAKKIFIPLIFSLIFFITVFQQSLSVHLMGYSFIFSSIFALGLSHLLITANNRFNSQVLGLVFSFPLIFGILILSIRVNFLTGLNG
jgi:hypothetical protein